MSATTLAAMIAAGAIGGATECDPTWDATIGDGLANGSVVAYEVYDAGNGPELYATGDFTILGGVGANRIARWDGTQWNPLGDGLSNQFSNQMEVFQGDLYVAGYFDSAGSAPGSAKIAKWDGSSWSGLDAQLEFFTNSLWALKTWDDGDGEDLYIGGNYTDIGGAGGPDYIARWDGSQFTEVGGTIAGAGIPLIVLDIEIFQGDLYIGGRFATVDGVAASHIARWDGTQWHDVGGGITGTQVIDLEVADDGSGPALFVGGSFTAAGGQPAADLAKWDGTSWTPLATGAGADGLVQGWQEFGGDVFVTGAFENIDGQPFNRIAFWDGSSLSPVGTGADGSINDAFLFEGRMTLGGGFSTVDGVTARSAIQLVDCGAANPADLDGDGSVGSSDLGMLIAAWGDCPDGGACPEDLDGDGAVGSTDLGILIAAWG